MKKIFAKISLLVRNKKMLAILLALCMFEIGYAAHTWTFHDQISTGKRPWGNTYVMTYNMEVNEYNASPGYTQYNNGTTTYYIMSRLAQVTAHEYVPGSEIINMGTAYDNDKVIVKLAAGLYTGDKSAGVTTINMSYPGTVTIMDFPPGSPNTLLLAPDITGNCGHANDPEADFAATFGDKTVIFPNDLTEEQKQAYINAGYPESVLSGPATSGSCGTNLNWAFSTGTLTITGSGAMDDYTSGNSPWYTHRANITSVSLPNGITSIGAYAFEDCTSLSSLTIPTSVTSIGANAISGVSNAAMASGTATLVDNNDAISIMTLLMDETRDITINRPAQKSNQYNTICLPFSMDADQIASSTLVDAEIYQYSDAEKDGDYLNLYFKPVTTMEAGVPYFIRYPQDGDNLTELDFADVTVTTATAGSVTHGAVTLHGTLSQVTINGSDKLYLAAGNNLKWYDGDKTINPFRAYFSVAGIAPNNAPKARIVAHENTTTNVESIQSSAISSQKIIENGQLFILKNGVKYNAQGQIVK